MNFDTLFLVTHHRSELFRISRWIDANSDPGMVQRAIGNVKNELMVNCMRINSNFIFGPFMGPTSMIKNARSGKKIMACLKYTFPGFRGITPGIHLAVLVHTYCCGRDFLPERRRYAFPSINLSIKEMQAYRRSTKLLKQYLFAGWANLLRNSNFHLPPFSDWNWNFNVRIFQKVAFKRRRKNAKWSAFI